MGSITIEVIVDRQLKKGVLNQLCRVPFGLFGYWFLNRSCHSLYFRVSSEQLEAGNDVQTAETLHQTHPLVDTQLGRWSSTKSTSALLLPECEFGTGLEQVQFVNLFNE